MLKFNLLTINLINLQISILFPAFDAPLRELLPRVRPLVPLPLQRRRRVQGGVLRRQGQPGADQELSEGLLWEGRVRPGAVPM